MKRAVVALLVLAMLSSVVSPAMGKQTKTVITLDTNDNTIVLNLTSSGVLIDSTGQKTAMAYLIGTIDNNYLKLKGEVMVDGKEYPITLEGKATKVFVGWDVPENAKSIKINLNGKTRIVYEGARRMYAVHVELEGDNFKLGGEFYEDGHGGLVGIAVIDGVKHEIGLRGRSIGLFEKINLEETESSKELDVPLRSQWEIFYEGHGYDAARMACGEASTAMLEEYWTGNHPDIWDIWVWNKNQPMGLEEAEQYLQSHSAPVVKWHKTGSLDEVINFVKYSIDAKLPLILLEKSMWGNLHAVVVRGYNYGLDKFFKLNDPNTWTGTNTMYWYHGIFPFNFEDNAYKNVDGEDKWNNGIAFVY